MSNEIEEKQAQQESARETIDYDKLANLVAEKMKPQTTQEPQKPEVMGSYEASIKKTQQVEKEKEEREKIVKATKYVTSFPAFIEENKNVLPKEFQYIVDNNKQYSSDDELYEAYRRDAVDFFFNEKENLEALSEKDKAIVNKWINSAKEQRLKPDLEKAYDVFKKAIEIKKAVAKERDKMDASRVNYGVSNKISSMANIEQQISQPGISREKIKELTARIN